MGSRKIVAAKNYLELFEKIILKVSYEEEKINEHVIV